jgi:hypothetical protein
MMNCFTGSGMEWMMGGMGLVGLLLFIALILGIGALAKYLIQK